MTIKEFHSKKISKIKYSHSDTPMITIEDFYNEFLFKKRLPKMNVVIEWHDLLVKYINDPTSKTFLVRKYESNKENGRWNNRRGAVIQFSDGFEVVYASNFLAHEIFMMAYYGFVPDYDDFKTSIENRTLPISSGTAIEKTLRSYSPCTNKTINCYFAHIMDVNGLYLRSDDSYKSLSHDEIKKMYPLGRPENWSASHDKIFHLSYQLDSEEKDLIKAHFLRFLDPMNYFLTPQTKHCKHSLVGFSQNIGEYESLKYYIQTTYKNLFNIRYEEFIKLGRFREEKPVGYTGKEKIDLEYSTSFSLSPSTKPSGSTTSKRCKTNMFAEFIDFMPSDKATTTSSYCNSFRRIMEELELDKLIDFELRLDYAIDYCTDKLDEAKKSNDFKRKKKYNDCRSALRKYKEFLSHKTP